LTNVTNNSFNPPLRKADHKSGEPKQVDSKPVIPVPVEPERLTGDVGMSFDSNVKPSIELVPTPSSGVSSFASINEPVTGLSDIGQQVEAQVVQGHNDQNRVSDSVSNVDINSLYEKDSSAPFSVEDLRNIRSNFRILANEVICGTYNAEKAKQLLLNVLNNTNGDCESLRNEIKDSMSHHVTLMESLSNNFDKSETSKQLLEHTLFQASAEASSGMSSSRELDTVIEKLKTKLYEKLGDIFECSANSADVKTMFKLSHMIRDGEKSRSIVSKLKVLGHMLGNKNDLMRTVTFIPKVAIGFVGGVYNASGPLKGFF
jgi:hypothetical protein